VPVVEVLLSNASWLARPEMDVCGRRLLEVAQPAIVA
jgi:hypothetical protein